MALFSSAPRSLCILRLSAIGDVCHAIAVVQAIQKHWPETNITWVTGKIEAQLISDLPGITVISFDKKQGLKGMKAVWRQLGSEKFDALLHMQVALRSSMLSLGIKAKYKVGFGRNRTREGQWFFTNKHLPNTEAIHVLDNFAEFARYIGVPFTTPRWNIPLHDSDISFAKSVIKGPSLVISPAASKDERNWTTQGYVSLAQYAHSKGLQVVLTGSPAQREVDLGDSICELSKIPITNLIGKTSLKQLTAVLKNALLVVAPDSGPAHLATTQNTPVIGLYAHSNPYRTGPYLDQNIVVDAYHPYITKQNTDQQNTDQQNTDQQNTEQQNIAQKYQQSLKAVKWGQRAKGVKLMEAITFEQVQERVDLILNKNNQLSDHT